MMRKSNTQQKEERRQNTNGTIFNAFVYLQFKDESLIPPKKIKYPPSYQSLMRIAKSLFSDIVDVQSLFTKNGKRIQFIDDVIPGDTLYVSPILEDGEAEDEIRINKRSTTRKKDQNQDNTIQQQASYNKLFAGPTDQEERVKVTVIGNPHLTLSSKVRDRSQIPKFKKYNENSDNNNQINDKNSQNQLQSSNSFKKGSFKSRKSTDNISEDYLSSETSENDVNKNKISSESLNSKSDRFNSQKQNQQESDQKSQKKSLKIRKNSSAWSIASEDERGKHVKNSADLSEIFQKVLHEDTLAQKVPESLYSIYNDENDNSDNKEKIVPLDFYTQLVNHSKNLDFYWIKKGLQLFDTADIDNQDFYGIEEMSSVARDIISKHRKPFAQSSETENKKNKSRPNKNSNNEKTNNFYSGVGYQFNLAIIGPRQSGKSTFLTLFARELLFELVATESNKKYFIFNIDMSKYALNIRNPEFFFHSIVDATMQSLQWNNPCYTPYIHSLSLFFKSITDESNEPDPDSYEKKPPLVPANFKLNPDFQYVASTFQSIASQMTSLWNNDEKYIEWMINVLFFPETIAKAVGFKQIIYLIDNVECVDVELDSSNGNHFKSFTDCIFLADLFKLVLSNGNYIVSCRSQEEFFKFIVPITDDISSQNFSNRIEFVSTLNLIDISKENQNENDDNDELYLNKVISVFVDVGKEELPIYITINHTGGIPPFVFLWKEINKLFDDLEQCEDGSDDYHEIHLAIINQALDLMVQLFLTSDGENIPDSLEVVDVKRSNSSKS